MNAEETPTTPNSDHNERRYSLAELTTDAGVSIRTVRYYISEGLLPPPITAGPRSYYTEAHLDRLRLIDRLKSNYLPLKEIRRQLDELDESAIRGIVSVEEPSPHTYTKTAVPGDSASAYISRLLHRPAPPEAVARLPSSPPRVKSHIREDPAEIQEEASMAPPEPELPSWRRIPLTEHAELLIRDDLYLRKRDRVDWLTGWARKVFR